MRFALAALAMAVMAASPAHAQPGGEALQGFADRALAGYVRPAAADFEAATASLSADVATLCETPGEASLQTAQASFRKVAEAWAGLSFLALDPLRQDDRQARVFFWPDPRGVTLRQVQGVLAEEDPAATLPAELRQKSVAVQGLGALEFLMFGSGSETLAELPMSFRCRYAQAMGENVHQVAQELQVAFAEDGAFASEFSAPGADNPLYRGPSEPVRDLIGSAATGLELAAERIVRPAMGESVETARPKTAPFWRSGTTLGYVGHMVGGTGALLQAGGIEAILPKDLSWLERSIGFEIANARAVAGRIAEPIEEAVVDTDGRRDLTALFYSLDNARSLVSEQLMSAAGLKAGFNALDGD
ncbi:imelysin family protein [Lutibaculum baratangense]|uniref:Iron-regulated protein A n=1 Tax=Lutibaculum baratangense AMV1 TaxID=631454 RepID=V4R8B1_9HYPH|nr:imelysin family protein [Lutibaculum baratangense]ESR22401.1 Iron-regulated protein A precursor [Lutibaculum baratangense AMV1]